MHAGRPPFHRSRLGAGVLALAAACAVGAVAGAAAEAAKGAPPGKAAKAAPASAAGVAAASAVFVPPPPFPDLVVPPDLPAPGAAEGDAFAFRWPLDRVVITSHFGSRKRPGKKKGKRFHGAVDMDGDLGESVRAAGPGRVSHAGWFFGYGNLVALNHHNHFQTLYGHLSEVHVFVGEVVRSGATLGLVGTTGTSTGTHLHFGVLWKGTPVDPEDLIGVSSEGWTPGRDDDAPAAPAKKRPPKKKVKKP